MSRLSVLALFFSCASLVAAAPTAHVFLIIGQSNSVGYNSDGFTSEDVTYPNILQTSCCVNGQADNNQCKIISGQDPLHHVCDTGFINSQNVGFGMSFARQFRSEMPAEDIIVLVPAGIGGTGFVDGVWTAYNGTGFVPAVARLRATFQRLTENYPTYTAKLEGYLWHQGETDAGTATEQFLVRDLIPMIAAWRDSNLLPQTNEKVPFVVGNLVPGWVADHPNMQLALQVLDQFVPYSASTPSQGLIGDIHFTASSHRIFGRRYYAAWKLSQANVVDTSV